MDCCSVGDGTRISEDNTAALAEVKVRYAQGTRGEVVVEENCRSVAE